MYKSAIIWSYNRNYRKLENTVADNNSDYN